jgi:hypothetical protein
VNAPKKASWVALGFSATLCAVVLGLRIVFPPPRPIGSADVSGLRTEQVRLGEYSDSAVHTAEAKLSELRRTLWTDATFAAWQKANIPSDWSLQDLGPADLQHLRGHRYAFQRPEATDHDWPAIAAVLRSLERAPATSVTSAALAVQPGYAGSRRFSQCLLIAVFYFTGDDGPTSVIPSGPINSLSP